MSLECGISHLVDRWRPALIGILKIRVGLAELSYLRTSSTSFISLLSQRRVEEAFSAFRTTSVSHDIPLEAWRNLFPELSSSSSYTSISHKLDWCLVEIKGRLQQIKLFFQRSMTQRGRHARNCLVWQTRESLPLQSYFEGLRNCRMKTFVFRNRNVTRVNVSHLKRSANFSKSFFLR